MIFYLPFRVWHLDSYLESGMSQQYSNVDNNYDSPIPIFPQQNCCGYYRYLFMKMRMMKLMTNVVHLWPYFMKKMVRRYFVPLSPRIHFVPVTMLLIFCPNSSPGPETFCSTFGGHHPGHISAIAIFGYILAITRPYLGHNLVIS